MSPIHATELVCHFYNISKSYNKYVCRRLNLVILVFKKKSLLLAFSSASRSKKNFLTIFYIQRPIILSTSTTNSLWNPPNICGRVYTGWAKNKYTIIVYIYTTYCISTFGPPCSCVKNRHPYAGLSPMLITWFRVTSLLQSSSCVFHIWSNEVTSVLVLPPETPQDPLPVGRTAGSWSDFILTSFCVSRCL